MRHLYLAAALLCALAATPAFANGDGDMDNDHDQMAQPMDWQSGQPAPAMRVMGLLTKEQVQQMKDAHAKAGLSVNLSIVPAGGINEGKYFVTGTLTSDEFAGLMQAHEGAGLNLDLRAMPVMPPMGMRMRMMDGDRDGDGMMPPPPNPDDMGMRGDDDHQMPPMNPPMMMPPMGGPGMWHRGRDGEGWRGMDGEGQDGWRNDGGCGCDSHIAFGPNYDVVDHCGHWEQDWHQDGCGKVHVHNLADWLPGHPGYAYGWPYAGWDDKSWPYIRKDGGAAWYTGAWWRDNHPKVTPPAWFDAQWTMFGDAYPYRFWLSTYRGGDPHAWPGHGWGARPCGGGCGCGGCGWGHRR